jgi:hypothetical protein
MSNNKMPAVDYKTHILLGRTSAGDMAVIGEWPHVPRQAEVQDKIKATRGNYATYLLCTPTSIMPGDENGHGGRRGVRSSQSC